MVDVQYTLHFVSISGSVPAIQLQAKDISCCTGILKTFLGLSASILTTIYGSLFTPDGISFLLFLAIGPACLAVLVLPLLNHVPHLEENETKHGRKWFTTGA